MINRIKKALRASTIALLSIPVAGIAVPGVYAQDPAQVEIRMGPGSSTVVQQFITLPVGRWTPEAIQQHPEDYLTACEHETKSALQKLQVCEISIAQQKTALSQNCQPHATRRMRR